MAGAGTERDRLRSGREPEEGKLYSECGDMRMR
jgi:hypothetical protein